MTSLYQLIKQKSQELGRPLKIISDWDETLFSFRASSIYKSVEVSTSFKQFFKEFWEHSSLSTDNNLGAEKIFTYHGNNEEIKKAYHEFLKLEKERKKDPDKNSDKWKKTNTVNEAPFLSIADELLKCLKEENLIGELVIVTTTRNSKEGEPSIIVLSKRERFTNTFGKFSQSKLEIMMVEKINGQNQHHRWEWIKENHSDFDVFIDDDIGIVTSVKERFPDKNYIMPDYKANRHIQGNNYFHVKQEVSDLKNEDFIKVAEECKIKKQAQLREHLQQESKIVDFSKGLKNNE